MHNRRHPGSSCCRLHAIHGPTLKDTSFEKVRRGVRIQLPVTHHHPHCIPSAHFPPGWSYYGLHLLGVPVYHHHADPSQLLAHIRYYTKLTTDYQQSQHTLWRHGRVNTNRLQLQLKLDLK